MSLLSFFLGRVTLTGEGSDAPAVLDLCMRYAIVYGECTVTQETDGGRLQITLSYRAAELLRRLARNAGIVLTVERREGILEVFRFCLSRPGIPLGVLLAVLLTVAASTHLWEIRVTGNVTLSSREVARELTAAGLTLGDPVRKIDVDAIENRLLMDSERISWVTVNLIGTVAEVQIREKLPTPAKEEDLAPANLVARRDGVILSAEVMRGNLLVKVGTAVRAGEVLVSGLYDSATLGFRYTRAKGAVYAETEHRLTVEVPYGYERTVRTGETGRAYALRFFGRTVPLFTRGTVAPAGEDGYAERLGYAERISYLTVFGRELPIALVTGIGYRSETETATRSPEEAMDLAYVRLAREIAAIEGFAGLLGKSSEGEVAEDRYILRCTVKCIEDIAVTREIGVGRAEEDR